MRSSAAPRFSHSSQSDGYRDKRQGDYESHNLTIESNDRAVKASANHPGDEYGGLGQRSGMTPVTEEGWAAA